MSDGKNPSAATSVLTELGAQAERISHAGRRPEGLITGKSAYEILTAAQDLIRDPKHWTQGAYARDERGKPVGPTNPQATCWCTSGAIIKSGGGTPFSNGLNEELTALLGREGPIHTNDDKGHDAVMAMFDRVREKAKQVAA